MLSFKARFLGSLWLALALGVSVGHAQTLPPKPLSTPWGNRPPASEPPPREVRLEEKPLDALSNHDIDDLGTAALAIDPQKWKHAETDNFIIHFRRATEARRVVREIEYNLWFTANFLGATKEQYSQKSHVFIFEDNAEWKGFISGHPDLPAWSASFAFRGALYLHIGGAGEGFDSHTLAHETTHVVVTRLYPQSRWPLWLNEGFAEYMGAASVSARKGQTLKSLQKKFQKADLPLANLVSSEAYPTTELQVWQFYQSSERLVRFLLTKLPKERFKDFVDAVLAGATFQSAIETVYAAQVPNFAKFEKEYEKFKN